MKWVGGTWVADEVGKTGQCPNRSISVGPSDAVAPEALSQAASVLLGRWPPFERRPFPDPAAARRPVIGPAPGRAGSRAREKP